MRNIVIGALLLTSVLLVAACSSSPTKELGQTCSTDRECKTGACIDLALVEPMCSGKVCTFPCKQASDCPSEPGRPDCHVFSGDHPSGCLYAEWVGQHCKMPAMPTE
jgi:hypothetical protein